MVENSFTMLVYQKSILKKVSFDWNLFEKEIIKSKNWLTEEHFDELVAWTWQNFRDIFSELHSFFYEILGFVPELKSVST